MQFELRMLTFKLPLGQLAASLACFSFDMAAVLLFLLLLLWALLCHVNGDDMHETGNAADTMQKLFLAFRLLLDRASGLKACKPACILLSQSQLIEYSKQVEVIWPLLPRLVHTLKQICQWCSICRPEALPQTQTCQSRLKQQQHNRMHCLTYLISAVPGLTVCQAAPNGKLIAAGLTLSPHTNARSLTSPQRTLLLQQIDNMTEAP